MNRNLMLVLVVGCCFAGCDRRDVHEQVTEEVDVSVKAKSDVPAVHHPVAVRIDGRDITRKDIIDNGRAAMLLNMNKARKTKIRKREILAVERYCRSAVNRELAKAAVAKYVNERGLSVSSNELKRATQKFERQYGVMSRKLRRSHRLADLKYMLKDRAYVADQMIMDMAMFEVMTNDLISTSKTVVTDDMIRRRLEYIDAANFSAAATNAQVFATATNVWRKITSGELTFEDAAQKYSEDEYIGDGCEWGCFTREQLEDDTAVLELLPTLKTGDITPPVESDGGLAILRKDEDDNPKTYSFSRVFFRLPYFFDKETPEAAREMIAVQMTKDLVQGTIRDYVGKLNVEYPDGTNMVWKLTSQDFK